MIPFICDSVVESAGLEIEGLLIPVSQLSSGEHSGSVIECLTRDRGAAGWSLTVVTA